MGIGLEVILGQHVGSRYLARAGYRLGRNSGEIIIPDKKISSIHAQIEDQNGQLVLVDRGSSNGLFVGDQRVSSIVLMPGVRFRVGKTSLLVIEGLEAPAEASSKNPRLSTEGAPGPVDWKDTLSQEIPNLLMQNYLPAVQPKAFPFSVRLDFAKGPEAGRGLLLLYGPRRFGTEILDIELQDDFAPHFAFEISSEEREIKITSQDSSALLLNGQPFHYTSLKSGDIIEVGKTQILVTLVASPLKTSD